VEGVHAVQMELACRGYMREPVRPVTEANWPATYDDGFAGPMRKVARQLIGACL
jgi:N-formylglutamate deformylase